MTTQISRKRFRIHDLLVVVGSLLALSLCVVLAVSWISRRSLAPFLELRPGHTPEEIRKLVGEPEYVTKSLFPSVRDHSQVDSFSCQEAREKLPSMLDPLFAEAGPNYGPHRERPLPEPTGQMYVYFPFLFEVVVYLDNESLVERVFLCHT